MGVIPFKLPLLLKFPAVMGIFLFKKERLDRPLGLRCSFINRLEIPSISLNPVGSNSKVDSSGECRD